ncbi:hypothetical protein Msip34_2463 [Methylovorus glucosotrophus SIP3-4]|uniref:Uncharacterized protein n=1 Tax=Methylovorus glucosotrophus (strain SIP3-4) TaxID=582744 RepID=C6XAF9_METGS|nr:hypothetical protein Msip34_2463 [Methylovorus glucosotrophus SIP3-4]
MNSFWGYAGADVLALIIIGLASLICLISARLFVSRR